MSPQGRAGGVGALAQGRPASPSPHRGPRQAAEEGAPWCHSWHLGPAPPCFASSRGFLSRPTLWASLPCPFGGPPPSPLCPRTTLLRPVASCPQICDSVAPTRPPASALCPLDSPDLWDPNQCFLFPQTHPSPCPPPHCGNSILLPEPGVTWAPHCPLRPPTQPHGHTSPDPRLSGMTGRDPGVSILGREEGRGVSR